MGTPKSARGIRSINRPQDSLQGLAYNLQRSAGYVLCFTLSLLLMPWTRRRVSGER